MTDDHELAARVAHDAGQLLLTLRTTSDDPSTLRAAGDAQANVLILDALRQARPDDPILSEESADDSHRLTSSRVWIVDPLDGTREFGE
ncbi:MAG: inositol monophosphatase family protein, partial [Acidimicrobiia bacterium]